MKQVTWLKVHGKDIEYPVGDNIASSYQTVKELVGLTVRTLTRIEQTNGSINGVNIWCRGSSGSILAGFLASELLGRDYFTRICYTHKEGEVSHYKNISPIASGINVFIDDFVSKGDTFNEVARIAQKIFVRQFDITVVSGRLALKKLDTVSDVIICKSFMSYPNDIVFFDEDGNKLRGEDLV